MTVTSLLSGSHLSLISSPYDGEVGTIATKLSNSAQIGGRGDVEELLCELLAATNGDVTLHRTLDLIGHSTPDRSLLRLGNWVIDATKSSVTSFFRGLAENDVMRRLGIRAVRLLGCETAATELGRATICSLAEILGVEVYGSRVMLNATYYTPDGFNDDFRSSLVSASEARGAVSPTPLLNGEPYKRTFDIETLPSSPITLKAWPTFVATYEQARDIVRMIRRNDGAYMPGLGAIPMLEVALPSTTKRSWFHSLQLVLEGSFVRIYPDANGPGVVFPVADPDRLKALVGTLEQAR
jgi:hypothetical protein